MLSTEELAESEKKKLSDNRTLGDMAEDSKEAEDEEEEERKRRHTSEEKTRKVRVRGAT